MHLSMYLYNVLDLVILEQSAIKYSIKYYLGPQTADLFHSLEPHWI